MNPENTTRRQLVIMAVLTEGGLAVVACLLGLLFGQYPWEQLRADTSAILGGVLITLPMLALFYVCVRLPVGPLKPIKQFVNQVVKPLFRKCTVLDLVLIAALAGLGEELLFRGVAQPLLTDWLGFWAGLILASVLFGLAHPMTVGYIFLAGLVGLYLGWFAAQFDNLFEVVLAHALYDFVGLVYLVRVDKE